MDIEDIECKIEDLETAYADIEEAISTNPSTLNGADIGNIKVLEQILDGIQYFINELTYLREIEEANYENKF